MAGSTCWQSHLYLAQSRAPSAMALTHCMSSLMQSIYQLAAIRVQMHGHPHLGSDYISIFFPQNLRPSLVGPGQLTMARLAWPAHCHQLTTTKLPLLTHHQVATD